jgi:hypothetical protein
MTMHLPVMDHRNKAIAEPDAFAVNTAMQRCLVKAIALHGLGLYIYAGEDLPLSSDETKSPKGSPAAIKEDAYSSLDDSGKEWIDALAIEVVSLLEKEGTEQANQHIKEMLGNPPNLIELRNALWHRLDSKTRSALKAKP